jgi:3-methyladenine DNA glycosylase Tag
MTHFNVIYDLAVELKQSQEVVESDLPYVASAQELTDIPDDRYLAIMTKRIFQAGFVWRIIEHKWDGFEAAFHGFDINSLTHLPDEAYEATVKDKRIIRNWQKIKTIPHNAKWIEKTSKEHQSFGKFIADWPEDNIIGLWDVFKKQGSRLGGMTTPYTLRSLGKDTFMPTQDVCKALVVFGLFDSMPTPSKRDAQKMQNIFNELQQQSGRPLSEISRILSYTTIG